MTISVSMIIGVVVLFLIAAFLIVGVINSSKKKAHSETIVKIDILRLLNLYFKHES